MPVGIDRSMMLLSIVSVLYCLLAIALAWKGPHRWQTYLLAVQLLLLLPGFYVFLRKSPGPERGPLPVPVPRWVLAAAAVVLGGVFVYFAPQWRFGVTLPDETAYWFQAKIFQTGSWYAQPLPVLPEVSFTPQNRYFEFVVEHEGKWFTQYPAGWPLILAAIGSLLPTWLVNPLLTLVLLALIYRMERQLVGSRSFPFTVAAACLSPFFLAFSVGLMSHISCAIFTALATMYVLRGLDCWRNVISAMFSLAAVCIIRPGVGAAVGPVLVAAAVWDQRKSIAHLTRLFFVGGVALGATLAFWAWTNQLLTGDSFTTPYAISFKLQHPNTSKSFTDVLHGFDFTEARWALQAIWLHSFPLLFPLAAVGLFKGAMPRAHRITLAALFGFTVLLHWYIGFSSASILGERYYFESFFALLLLAASGWRWLVAEWRLSGPALTTAWAFTCLIAGVQVLLFLQILQARLVPYYEIVRVAEQVPLKNGIVFFADNPLAPAKHLNRNDGDWRRASRLYLPDPGPDFRGPITQALGRTAYVVAGYSEEQERGLILDQGP